MDGMAVAPFLEFATSSVSDRRWVVEVVHFVVVHVDQLRHPSARHKIDLSVGQFLERKFVKIFHLSLLLCFALAGVRDVVHGRCDSRHTNFSRSTYPRVSAPVSEHLPERP